MLRVGDTVQAKLIEEIEKDRWIVSFQGTLSQVLNTTNISFEKSKRISLVVERVSPLELRVKGSAVRRRFSTVV